MGKALTTQQFISKSKIIHGDKFDYGKVNYTKCNNKVTIYCNKCKIYFKQRASSHIHGIGCPKCSNNMKLTIDEIISRSNEIHNNKYDYSKLKNVNSRTKSIFICPTHGEFNQLIESHLSGKGCPKCARNVKLTVDVIEVFEEVGSGMNDNRPKMKKLFKLISEKKINKVIIEHKDRLTRFNFKVYEMFFNIYYIL